MSKRVNKGRQIKGSKPTISMEDVAITDEGVDFPKIMHVGDFISGHTIATGGGTYNTFSDIPKQDIGDLIYFYNQNPRANMFNEADYLSQDFTFKEKTQEIEAEVEYIKARTKLSSSSKINQYKDTIIVFNESTSVNDCFKKRLYLHGTFILVAAFKLKEKVTDSEGILHSVWKHKDNPVDIMSFMYSPSGIQYFTDLSKTRVYSIPDKKNVPGAQVGWRIEDILTRFKKAGTQYEMKQALSLTLSQLYTAFTGSSKSPPENKGFLNDIKSLETKLKSNNKFDIANLQTTSEYINITENISIADKKLGSLSLINSIVKDGFAYLKFSHEEYIDFILKCMLAITTSVKDQVKSDIEIVKNLENVVQVFVAVLRSEFTTSTIRVLGENFTKFFTIAQQVAPLLSKTPYLTFISLVVSITFLVACPGYAAALWLPVKTSYATLTALVWCYNNIGVLVGSLIGLYAIRTTGTLTSAILNEYYDKSNVTLTERSWSAWGNWLLSKAAIYKYFLLAILVALGLSYVYYVATLPVLPASFDSIRDKNKIVELVVYMAGRLGITDVKGNAFTAENITIVGKNTIKIGNLTYEYLDGILKAETGKVSLVSLQNNFWIFVQDWIQHPLATGTATVAYTANTGGNVVQETFVEFLLTNTWTITTVIAKWAYDNVVVNVMYYLSDGSMRSSRRRGSRSRRRRSQVNKTKSRRKSKKRMSLKHNNRRRKTSRRLSARKQQSPKKSNKIKRSIHIPKSRTYFNKLISTFKKKSPEAKEAELKRIKRKMNTAYKKSKQNSDAYKNWLNIRNDYMTLIQH